MSPQAYSPWRVRAREVIYEALLEYEAQQCLLQEEFVKKDAIKFVSSKYPFGERGWWPYKQWLLEFKACKKFLELNKPMKEFLHFCPPPHPKPQVVEGQMMLSLELDLN